ncbi:MAG: hypothetical protein M3Z66_19370 [Chloroflexota bacterium]|nr:hypothetical protein [Chloroflexota bacterium]
MGAADANFCNALHRARHTLEPELPPKANSSYLLRSGQVVTFSGLVTAATGTVTTVTQGPDSRFGMQAPIPRAITVKTPGGLQSSTTASRTVTLSNPGNVLSLTNQTSSLTVNGKTLTSSYDAASHTYTTTTAMGKTYTTQVDAQQRPVLVQVPGLAPVSYTYDSRGRPR